MSASERSRRNTFAALTLERAAERRDDAPWLASLETATDSRFLLLDADGKVFTEAATHAPLWLDAGDRQRLLAGVPASLLGLRGDKACLLLALDRPQSDSLAAQLGAQRVELRVAGDSFDPFDAGLFAYARGLAHWQASMRFCHVCGAPLRLVSAGHRALCTSPACAHLHFPRTDAAIIVVVEHDGACLLGRQASWPAGRYSTLAGFVEPGETLEDAVRREVYEEAGVQVIDCDYHSSQPWPFPASLMLGFTAVAASRKLKLRDGELEDARWFTPAQILHGIADGSLHMSSRLSVAWRLIEHWMRERAGIELGEAVDHVQRKSP